MHVDPASDGATMQAKKGGGAMAARDEVEALETIERALSNFANVAGGVENYLNVRTMRYELVRAALAGSAIEDRMTPPDTIASRAIQIADAVLVRLGIEP
jgi:hypothetical protein